MPPASEHRAGPGEDDLSKVKGRNSSSPLTTLTAVPGTPGRAESRFN